MDLNYGPEYDEFKDEVRLFITENEDIREEENIESRVGMKVD